MFKNRLTMPKMIVVGVNDYFWPADDSRHYFDELPGANYMRVLPNAEHSLALAGVSTEHFIFSIRSLYLMVMLDMPLPTVKMLKYELVSLYHAFFNLRIVIQLPKRVALNLKQATRQHTFMA